MRDQQARIRKSVPPFAAGVLREISQHMFILEYHGFRAPNCGFETVINTRVMESARNCRYTANPALDDNH
jgi:hypothetical protein